MARVAEAVPIVARSEPGSSAARRPRASASSTWSTAPSTASTPVFTCSVSETSRWRPTAERNCWYSSTEGFCSLSQEARLDRVSDRTGVLAELPYAEVRLARVGGEPIPLLEDLLGSFPGVRVNIDIKAAGAIDPLIETLDRTGAQDRV